MYIVSRRILLKFNLNIASILICFVTNLCAQVNDDHKDHLSRVFDATCTRGSFGYEIAYKTLGAEGDTTTLKSIVTAKISEKGSAFTAFFSDSLMLVYFNNELLFVNLDKKYYHRKKVRQSDIEEEVDVLFPPMVDKDLGKALLGSDAKIKFLERSDSNITYRIDIVDPDELDSLVYFLTVSGISNTIRGYSYSASIFSINIYEEYCLHKFELLDDSITLETITHAYNNIISNFTLKERGGIFNNDSLLIQFDKLKQQLPYFDLISITGDTFKISNNGSDYYLVDFWYKSCYPCLKAIPMLKYLSSRYAESELQIVSINPIDNNYSSISSFIMNNKINYNVYVESLQVGRNFKGVHVFPLFILYDSNLDVVMLSNGYSDTLINKIENIISNR